MPNRRKFLQTLSASGIALAGLERLAAEPALAANEPSTSFCIPLRDGWEFRLDPTGSDRLADADDGVAGWTAVQVPHTWQSLGRHPDYVGVAWYRLRLDAPADWASQHVRVEFEAVNHTAHVFLNGTAAGQHIGKGYTAFALDLSPLLQFRQENSLLVRVDNRPGDRMLPRNKSYDWTDDGGIIRPVNLLLSPRTFMERVEIDAEPDLASGSADIHIRATVRNARPEALTASLHAQIRREGHSEELLVMEPVEVPLEAHGTRVVELGRGTLPNAAMWHFDTPNLYEALVKLDAPSGRYELIETFGIRRFETRGDAFYLNGEKVSLIGVERMAGSHPELGFAETAEWIASNHRDMKELNCVFTRVHWPQDKRVLEFCDRHGILMQEEIPAWGPETFSKTSDEVQHALEQNGLEQLREMIQRDRNHPCIVAWGLCNEVDGKNPRTRHFAQTLSAEARRLDPSRLQTYASNTLGSDPGTDMAGEFDFISTNEYFGSWTPGGPTDVEAHLDGIRKAFPGKPIVVSEYGWCECQPKILPGDESRVDIINSHTEVFRKFPEVAGAIYFDYNDYRTLVGDKGAGALRQRVHGVVDLYGTPKPSFEALRLQASPIARALLRRVDEGRYQLDLRLREQLPAYALRGYSLRWLAYGYDNLPMDGIKMELPDLHPGAAQTFEARLSVTGIRKVVVDLLRPNCYSAFKVEFLEDTAMS